MIHHARLRPMTSLLPLEVRRLCCEIDERAVLDDVSFVLEAGEILGLVGEPGAGKSALIRTILAQLSSTTGDASIFGRPHGKSAGRDNVGYLPERFRPPGHLSGHDFVGMSRSFHGHGASRAQAELLAGDLGLDPSLLRRPIRTFSKAAIQKLGVLTILLTGRPLLMLDQPMSGLDPAARSQVKAQLRLYAQKGGAVLASSRIMPDHEGLCDRVVMLHHGRLIYQGAIGDLCKDTGTPTLESAFLALTRPEGCRQAG
jgi:ABC-2 type transport system ATP-binding protein